MTDTTRMTIDISSGTLFRVLVFVAGLWFLWFIADILLLLIVSILIASAIEPIASTLQRFHIPRSASVLTVYLVFLGIVAGIALLLVPPLVNEVQTLARDLPAAYERLIVIFGNAGGVFGIADLFASLQEGLLDLGNVLAKSSGSVFATTRSVFGSVFMVILTFIISFYLVIARNGLVTFARSLVPVRHQPYVLSLVERSQEKIGRWVIAQLILGVIVGAVTFVGLWSLGVPYALALALLAGFFELIPVFGPLLSAIPAVFIGFTQEPLTGVLVLVLYIVVQQLENHILVPNIMRRAIGLNPLTTIVALLIGAKLAGLLGILLAVPVVTVLAVFFGDLLPGEKDTDELPA